MARRPPSSKHRAPRGLRDGRLLAGQSVAIREGIADRAAEGRDGEVVLVGMAVRELLELAVGRVVRRRPADHRHAGGHLGDPSQDLLLGSHEGDGQQGARLAAKLREGGMRRRLAGRVTVALADGRHADPGRPVRDQHQAGRAAFAGDPAGVLEDAGGRRSAPERHSRRAAPTRRPRGSPCRTASSRTGWQGSACPRARPSPARPARRPPPSHRWTSCCQFRLRSSDRLLDDFWRGPVRNRAAVPTD